MSQVVVDTSILAKLFAGTPEVAEKLNGYSEIFVPFVVVGELYAGLRLGNGFEKNQASFRQFLDNPNVRVLQSTEEITLIYAELFAYLRKQGTPIPINDVWVAAIALKSGLPFYSLDSDFKNLPQLRLV